MEDRRQISGVIFLFFVSLALIFVPARGAGQVEVKLESLTVYYGTKGKTSELVYSLDTTPSLGTTELKDSTVLRFVAEFSAGGKPIEPSQVALLVDLQTPKGTAPLNAVLQRLVDFSSSGSGKYELVLEWSDKRMAVPLAGEFSLTLIVADTKIKNPIKKEISRVPVVFAHQQRVLTVPLSPSKNALVYRIEESLFPAPLISHLFRPPHQHPHPVFPAIFAVACAVMLPAVLIGWKEIGINFSLISGSAFAVPFVGVIGTVIGLLFLFWLCLNIVQTVTFIIPVFLVGLYVGNKTLCYVKEKRLCADEQKKDQ